MDLLSSNASVESLPWTSGSQCVSESRGWATKIGGGIDSMLALLNASNASKSNDYEKIIKGWSF